MGYVRHEFAARREQIIFNKSILPWPMPIIVGSPRSGTTLLRFMLDSHPEMAIPPETGFLLAGKQLNNIEHNLCEQFLRLIVSYPPDAPAWEDFHIPVTNFRRQLIDIRPFNIQEGFRLFYKMYASRFGKTRWGDKTPVYCRHLLEIRELLPEAHFIHIIRDGRDVATSLRTQRFSPGYDIATQATYWRDNILTAHTQGNQCLHYFEIHYEELIRDPKRILSQVCEFIQLDFHHNMLKYYEYVPQRLQEHLDRRQVDGSLLISQTDRHRQQANTTRPPDISKIGVWKNILKPEEIQKFEEIAGDTLQRFGYPVGFSHDKI